MKYLLAIIPASLLLGCATDQAENINVSNTRSTYARHSTTHVVTGPTGTAYQTWSTADLQARRLKLYAMVPTRPGKGNVPQYVVRGTQLPQQDEIRAIEAELNKRYKAGDKSAELKDAWPKERRYGP